MKQRLLVAVLLFGLSFSSTESRADTCGTVSAVGLAVVLVGGLITSAIFLSKYTSEQYVKSYSCWTDADGDDYDADSNEEPLQSFLCCQTNGESATNCEPISKPCPAGKTGICNYGAYGWRGADWIYTDQAVAIQGGTGTVVAVTAFGIIIYAVCLCLR